MSATRINWGLVLNVGASIVSSYDTGVTLRQLHYQLVSRPELGYPNTQNAYKGLSSRTAEARRNGNFPALIDRGRSIHEPLAFRSPRHAVDVVRRQYRLDRTRGQDESLFVGVEKNGLVEQLRSWFFEQGLPVLALGGYSGQSYVDEVASRALSAGRPAVLIYAGDFDPSGIDILRDFIGRTNVFTKVHRVALNREQIDEYGLPPMPGKATDSRAAGFVRTYGELMQVEVDALDPDILRGLLEDVVDNYWDTSAFDEVLGEEQGHLDALTGVVNGMS